MESAKGGWITLYGLAFPALASLPTCFHGKLERALNHHIHHSSSHHRYHSWNEDLANSRADLRNRKCRCMESIPPPTFEPRPGPSKQKPIIAADTMALTTIEHLELVAESHEHNCNDGTSMQLERHLERTPI